MGKYFIYYLNRLIQSKIVDSTIVISYLNRQAALDNIQALCPPLAKILLNTCTGVTLSSSDQATLLSGEGTTQGLCIYNSLCADMVMWISTLVGKIMLHKMHDSKLEVCPLSKDH